jgi:hypothetical protein
MRKTLRAKKKSEPYLRARFLIRAYQHTDVTKQTLRCLVEHSTCLVFEVLGGHKRIQEFTPFRAFVDCDFATCSGAGTVAIECFPEFVDARVPRTGADIEKDAYIRLK